MLPYSPMKTPYERIGGEATVKQLVERFYDLMEMEQAYHGIRHLHPQNGWRIEGGFASTRFQLRSVAALLA